MANKKLDKLGIAAFFESMGMMLQAGITVQEALELLKSEDKEGSLSEAIKRMDEDMDASLSLDKAMENCGVFPEYAVNMVKAAQSTGRLEQTMFHLSDYYKNEKKMNDNLRSALLYPATMLVMLIAVLFIMIRLVLPVFNDVYESLSGNLSSGAFPYMNLSYILCRVLLAVMLIIFVLMILGVVLYKGENKKRIEKILRKIPIAASILDTMALLRFTSGYDMYLSSGAMQDEALLNSMPLADNEVIEEKLQAVARSMEEGNGFAKSAYDNDLYEPVYGRTLIPAERSGNIEKALSRLVDLLRDGSADLISRLVNTLEPLLSGILMIAVAIVLLSLMLPLIGIMNSIS